MRRIAMQIAAAFGAVVMFVGSTRAADITLTEDTEWLDGRPLSGTINLAGHKLTVRSLTGDATITDSAAPNLIQDGTFEEVTIPDSKNKGAYAYFNQGATSSYWETPDTANVGFTKLSSDSPWTKWVSGTKAAFIQGNTTKDITLQQTVMVPEDGEYLLTYSYTWRPNGKSQRLEVHVDDGPVCGFTDSSESVAETEIVLDLKAGPRTIKFIGTTPHDVWATTVLDDVSLRKIRVPGELHVFVPEGETEEASSVELTGALKLVKEGDGTLALKKAGQTYSGGTVVTAGTLASLVDFATLPCGIAGSAISVGKDAVLDRKGASGLGNYRLVLDGGILTCTYNSEDSDHSCQMRDLELTADSRIVFDSTLTVGADITILGDAVWELNGHVLDIVFAGTDPDVFARNGMTLRHGTIRTTMMAGKGWFQDQGINGKDGGCLDISTILRLTCSGASGTGTYSTISNLTIRTQNSGVGSSGCQMIYGAYAPLSSYAYKVELQDGSTLSLGEFQDAWSITPLNGSACTATFAEGATINLDLGNRQLLNGMKLIGWAEEVAPSSTVKFKLPDEVGDDFMLQPGSDGLYVEAAVKTATWIGEFDTDCTNPKNWVCRDANGNVIANARPGSITAVTVSGEVLLDIPANSFSCASFTCDNVSLKGECDWSGLGQSMSGTIDLAGHKLTVSSLTGDATITDSTEEQNIIQDGSFEEVTIPGSANYAYFSEKATSTYWATTVPNRVGFTKGAPWTSWVSGTKAAFIQGDPSLDVTLQQTVTVPEDGRYLLTYFYTGRPATSAKSQRLEVHVDNGPVCGFTDDSSSASVEVKEIVLDLKAGPRTIKFIGTTPHDAWATTVLDDMSLRRIGVAGELHVSVPEGRTVEASSVELAGALKLVKEGAGTLVLKKAGQAYTGGTVVAAGTLASLVDFSTLPCGIAGSAISVGKDAVLDRKGAGGLDSYCLVLDGGMLTCTYNPADGNHTCTLRDLELTADSRIVFDAALTVGADITVRGDAVWELNGHVLDIVFAGNDPDMWVQNGMTLRHGTVRTTMPAGKGWLHDQGINGKDGGCFDLATNLRLECNGTDTFGAFSTVSNLTIRTPNNNVSSKGYQMIYGAYAPLSSYAYKVEMQDGSTLNLGERTNAWSITPQNDPACTATFAEGATIFVDMGKRKIKSSEPVVTWTAKPENVKFCAAPGTKGTFDARDDGLYRYIGFGIIVR